MLFSVITVTRNNLPGLRETRASLAAQSFQGFEWVIVDGASTDGTLDFLKSTEAAFTSEPDTGIYDAMNKGIERASGYFLLFLNAGDALASDTTLEELAVYIQELQVTPDFIYGDALEGRPGAEPAYKPARPYQKSAYGMFTHHQAMLYRKDLIGDLRYDQNYSIAADYKFSLQYLANVKTVVYAPFPLCLFEQGGISQQQAAQGRREQFAIRRELRTVPGWHNRLISLAQQTVWTLRRTLPGLYWRIKSAKPSLPRSDTFP